MFIPVGFYWLNLIFFSADVVPIYSDFSQSFKISVGVNINEDVWEKAHIEEEEAMVNPPDFKDILYTLYRVIFMEDHIP